jgi:mRNA deadenylase 3'-5' endonuclease subunit Ccr4
MENTFMQKPNVEGAQDAFSSAYSGYHANTQLTRPQDAPQVELPEGKKDEPPHTTVNFRRCWTIDYIWHSTSGLVPTRVLEIPSEAVLRCEEGPPDWFNRLAMLDSYSKLGRLPSGFQGNHNGIPNSRFGSDHVPLMAEFAFVAPPANRGVGRGYQDDDEQLSHGWQDDEETKA